MFKNFAIGGENINSSTLLKNVQSSPGEVTQLVGTFSHASKGSRFNFRSGHIPRL